MAPLNAPAPLRLAVALAAAFLPRRCPACRRRIWPLAPAESRRGRLYHASCASLEATADP